MLCRRTPLRCGTAYVSGSRISPGVSGYCRSSVAALAENSVCVHKKIKKAHFSPVQTASNNGSVNGNVYFSIVGYRGART